MAFIRSGLNTLGKALRETGQALDRVGLEALGSDSYKELCKCMCDILGCLVIGGGRGGGGGLVIVVVLVFG